MFEWFLSHFKPKPEVKLCKDSSVDCFPGQSNPEPLCPAGYCLVHHVCNCRDEHKMTG